MAQDIVNKNQNISYTNLDFSSIYTEILELIKQLNCRWDPSGSDESDPGVILVKLAALVADKCNYNIDKSILEAFPLSVTQEENARQLYEQLGYYMDWYQSSSVPVVLNWIKTSFADRDEVKSYTIPKFTIITDDEGLSSHNYSLIGVEGPDGLVVSDGILTTDSKELRMIAMEGTATQYSYITGETVITSQMIDKYNNRLYFADTIGEGVFQNGIFIKNTKQENYASWKRVDNLYEQNYDDLRYKFGFDSTANCCYIEFPDNYAELIGDGIEITYLTTSDIEYTGAKVQSLNQFLVGVTPKEDSNVVLNSSNVAINNYAKATGHMAKEDINTAYTNYKKTVGTFKTLITLRDYLNYIKSEDLDICSNAFVCDRTNDIQTVYKIMSKSHNLDVLSVKVEQIVDKTPLESTFDYTFKKSEDKDSVPGKSYYTIVDDELQQVVNTTGGHPSISGWYEHEKSKAQTHEAITPFSLKFYLLQKAISLDSKDNYNETFEMSRDNLDINSLLGDTEHLEHTIEDILPLGKHYYKVTNDEYFLSNKLYYTLANDRQSYNLYTDYTPGDSTSSETTVYYEISKEALLPHTVLLKNIYPIEMSISTYSALNPETQNIIIKNVIDSLYKYTNSTKIEFGEQISVDYLTQIVKNSDDRIKDVSFNSISYTTKAVYYDDLQKEYKTITLPNSLEDLQPDYNSIPGSNATESTETITSKFIARDILCKSILAGFTSLLVSDDVFTYHLKHKFINYYDNITSITSKATIDIGSDDAELTYSSDVNNPYIRKTYTLKPNEILSLYRPSLTNVREFLSGIHYEYLLYNDIKAGQSHELQEGEYIIFYQSYYSGDDTTKVPEGFTVFACKKGIILSPSFDMVAQTNSNSWTTYAKLAILPYFDDPASEEFYETSTYASGYVTEIYNNSSIINNAISGTDSIKLQTLNSVEIEIKDDYKFFWVLNTPDYSNDNKIKTYTLFPEFDVSTERQADREKNSYTLKSGEWLYYVDSSYSNLATLGAGTTIFRNCGVDVDEYNDAEGTYSFSYTPISEFEPLSANERFNKGVLEKITSVNYSGEYVINPKLNGWYEKVLTIETGEYKYIRTLDTEFNSTKEYYVITINDNAGLYKRIGDSAPYQHSKVTNSSEVFSEVNLTESLSNINPSEKGYYEIVSIKNSGVQDNYSLSESNPYNNYYRYTSTNDTSILSRFILSNASYSDLDISDTNTYKDVTITDLNSADFDYISQRLLTTNGDSSYKKYYTDSTGSQLITNIEIFDNPSNGQFNHTGQPWYEEGLDGQFILTSDTKPIISYEENSLKYPTTLSSDYCFEEVKINSWNDINFGKKGYFYKENSETSTYSWTPSRLQVYQAVSTQMLSTLITLYTSIADRFSSNPAEIINYIMTNWPTKISYKHPFKTSTKLGWRTRRFTEVTSSDNYTYVGITASTYRNNLSNIYPANVYPRFSLTDLSTNSADVIIPKEYAGSLEVVKYYTYDEVNKPFIEILNKTPGVTTDATLVSYLEYLKRTFLERLPLYFGMEWIPNIYKFKDLVKLTEKSYYTPDIYVTKSFGKIDAWTCPAIDNDIIAQDPIGIIEDNWQSLQNNTSLKVTENEIWSFAEGDTVRFESPVASQKSVIWPIFNNVETKLDLDSYSITYQRNGKNIEELNKLDISGYDWQGYSHLLLNTSSTEGQKLESNQSVILYRLNKEESTLEEITTINGSDYTNVTFQLKHPVDNVSGRFIDVTIDDIYGVSQPNMVYEFVPLSEGDNYKFTNDNITYAYFNVENKSIINSQVNIPLELPKGKYLIPVHGSQKGIKYTVSKYIKAWDNNKNVYYCPNMTPIPTPSITKKIRVSHNSIGSGFSEEPYGEYLFGFNSNGIVSENNNEYYLYDEDYNYLKFDIELNPSEESGFIKVNLPAHISEYYSQSGRTASPSYFGWYEKDGSGQFIPSQETGTGLALIQEVEAPQMGDVELYSKWVSEHNPAQELWYETTDITSFVKLTFDTKPVWGKTYYKDKEYYVPKSNFDTPVLKIDASSTIDINVNTVSIILNDIFKYEENETFGKSFNIIKNKINQLDDEGIYNYTFKPNSNDLISNPLDPKEFFNPNHPFNKFTIAQLDFDNLEYRFIT